MTTIETQSLSTWWRILSRSIVLWLSNDVIVCPLHADQTRNPIPFPSCRFLEVLAASDWLVSGQVQFAGCAVRDSCSGVQIRSSGDIRAPVGHSRLATLIVTVCCRTVKCWKNIGRKVEISNETIAIAKKLAHLSTYGNSWNGACHGTLWPRFSGF